MEDAKASGDVVLLALLDVKGAFDTLPHEAISQALDLLGIQSNLRKFLENFLTNRTFRVRVGKVTSSSRPMNSGVPQGSVVSPFLFNLALAQLPTTLPRNVLFSIGCAIYADDIAL